MITTALTQFLGIKHPILLAPMAGVAGGELASAVSRAGGFGIVGGGYGEEEFLERELSLVDQAHTFGVGFITWRLAKNPQLLTTALAHKPRAILLSFGDSAPFVEEIKSSNALLFVQCQTLSDARKAADLGADLIIAQGTEAGGHGSNRATMSLLPAVIDALPAHMIVGAGGIGDGRGLAACLSLGAKGVMLGSRFYTSKESLATETAKREVIEGSGDDTTRSSVFDVLREYDWPKPYNLRTLKNAFTSKFENDMPSLLAAKSRLIEDFNQARVNQDYDKAPVIVGEATDLINDSPAAAELVERVIQQAEKAIHANHLLVTS